MKTLTPAALLAAFAVTACGQPTTPTGPAVVEVGEALCRPTPKGRDVTACYVTLTASQNDRLISVSTPLAAEGQIHEMNTEGGIMRRAPLPDGLALPAGEVVSLRPGAEHIMLIGLKQPLAEGEQVPLTLTFEKAVPFGARAVVGTPAIAGTHDGGAHNVEAHGEH